MSLYEARSFLTYVSQNRGLQHKVENALWDSKAVLGLAETLGYKFSIDDLQAAIAEAWGLLSEDELAHVAGGGGNGRTGTGGVTTTKGGTTSSDGTQTPPPGDVSGNSCFFSRSK